MTDYKKIYTAAFALHDGTIMERAEDAVLRVLAYYDIFHYPLTREEVRRFASQPLPAAIAEKALEQLVKKQQLFYYKGYYSLQDNPLLVYRRKDGNERAVSLLQKAEKVGRFLYQFPFVTAVGVSGSLSKNYADGKADIDFFIITRANRLWIARTLMHLYKKLTFLTGRQHYYCMNYYIDEDALHLPDQNIFTAIELKTLLPVSGEKAMQHFFEANNWAETMLPQCNWRRQTYIDPRRSLWKKAAEWLIRGTIANRLNSFLWKLTDRRWKKKEARRKLNDKGIPMGLITGIHVAKSNAGDFQEKVLALYEQKVATTCHQSNPFNQVSFVK